LHYLPIGKVYRNFTKGKNKLRNTNKEMDRHRHLVNEREEIIDELARGVDQIHSMANDIHSQVKDQEVLIDETNKAVEKTQKKMGFVMGKLSTLLKTNDNKQLYTIMLLFGVMMFQILLIMLKL